MYALEKVPDIDTPKASIPEVINIARLAPAPRSTAFGRADVSTMISISGEGDGEARRHVRVSSFAAGADSTLWHASLPVSDIINIGSRLRDWPRAPSVIGCHHS